MGFFFSKEGNEISKQTIFSRFLEGLRGGSVSRILQSGGLNLSKWTDLPTDKTTIDERKFRNKPQESHLQFIVKCMIPYMTHIIPILHYPVVHRIRYIKLMSQICTAFANNNILNITQTTNQSNFIRSSQS